MQPLKNPDDTILALLRELGVLIGLTGIYGATHNVPQNAARAVFPMLEDVVRTRGKTEITLRDRTILINGVALLGDASAAKTLLERLVLHKSEGLCFLPPADRDEFLKCVMLLGTPPAALAAEGGFGEAMRKANLRSVRAVNVTYRRMTGASSAIDEHPEKSRGLPRGCTAAVGVLDLDAQCAAPASTLSGVPFLPDTDFRAPAVDRRQQRSAALAEQLRKAAALLEQGTSRGPDGQPQDMQAAFRQIREMVASLTPDSEQQIRTLAGQVHADRQTVAAIEAAARRRGIGLQLSREELVNRYAEINQEIAQPLTVSVGALDLLNSGKAGNLSDSQRELLKLASEGVERVNRLMHHLEQISGLPASLTPDAEILKSAYT